MKPEPKLAHRVIDGLAFVMDPRDNVLHSLNSTGTLIWKGLSAGKAPDRIAAELGSAFDVTPEQAGRDVEAFLGALRAKGLVIDG